jgi:hypothetical protein
MADDRLKKLAFKWGLVALAMQILYLLQPFVATLFSDITDLLEKEKLDVIALRFGQLKPPIFKFPSESLYLWAAILTALVCLVAIWWAALRDLFRKE